MNREQRDTHRTVFDLIIFSLHVIWFQSLCFLMTELSFVLRYLRGSQKTGAISLSLFEIYKTGMKLQRGFLDPALIRYFCAASFMIGT